MIPTSILNSTVNVMRRASTGRDALNNPEYGAPTSGSGWSMVYQAVKVRLAFSSRGIRFSPEGERIQPNGVMYYNPGPALLPEDRIITADGIEYAILDIVPGYNLGGTVDHWEARVALP